MCVLRVSVVLRVLCALYALPARPSDCSLPRAHAVLLQVLMSEDSNINGLLDASTTSNAAPATVSSWNEQNDTK